MTVAGHKLPLLITENYGRGRTAVFATGGDWRWQMLQPMEDMSHEMFWRQLLRWLVSDTPRAWWPPRLGRCSIDDGHVQLRAEVRDTTYLPASDAQVEARIVGPGRRAETVELHPDPLEQGVYTGRLGRREAPAPMWPRSPPSAASEDLGRDVVTFRRENGVAENFHLEQNRDLLEKLSSQTGGRYYQPDEVSRSWARTSPIRKPGSRSRNAGSLGHAGRYSSWRCCCAAPSGCCAENGV